jgi:hypothetical protein
MAQFIIHKDGAYNIFGTIADAPYFENALTLDQLEQYTLNMFGEDGLRALPERLERAHLTGCSNRAGWTLEECISGNRAGPHESTMPTNEFIQRYLTLANPSSAPHA